MIDPNGNTPVEFPTPEGQGQSANLGNRPENKSFPQEVGPELPISVYRKEIKETISSNNVTIIVGETGSGKTTQVPLFMLETLAPEDKIAVTQPR